MTSDKRESLTRRRFGESNKRGMNMRREFVECETEAEALDQCPWAAVAIKVDGGYQCFESVADAETWAEQV